MTAIEEFRPAFKRHSLSAEERTELEGRCAVLLASLEQVVGPVDRRLRIVKAQYEEMIADGMDLSWQVTHSFLKWANRFPDDIGREAKHAHRDPCDNGWKLVDEETQTYRPCKKCRPDLHELITTEKGFMVSPMNRHEKPHEQQSHNFEDAPPPRDDEPV